MSRTRPKERGRNPSFGRLFPHKDRYLTTQANTPRSPIHTTSAEPPLATPTKDLRRHKRQALSLSSTLEKERADRKKHFEDLKATHAKDLAIVNENHVRQLAEINVKHKEEITRVKMWCAMNQPRPDELSRVRERQRRSALQAELRRMKEEAESRDLWNEATIQELKRDKDEVEHRLAKLQRQWDDMVAWFPS